MVSYQLWVNAFLSYIGVIVSYITYFTKNIKDIEAFSNSFGWVSGATMISNGVLRSLYFFSKNQPVKWSRSVAFLNIGIGIGIIYSVKKNLFIALNILIYIAGSWFIFESIRILFVYHKKLNISPASPVLISNFVFGISLIIFNNKYTIENES